MGVPSIDAEKEETSSSHEDTSHQDKLSDLKQELLMLASLKNHDPEQTELIELCGDIPIDDHDAVQNFVEEARRVRYRGQPDIDVIVAQSQSFDDDGSFEVLQVPSIPEEEEEEEEDDGEAKDDVDDAKEEGGDGGGVDKEDDEDDDEDPFYQAPSFEETPSAVANRFNTLAKIPGSKSKRRNFSDDRSVSSTMSLGSLAGRLVTAQAKLVTTQAKQSAEAVRLKASNSSRVIELKVEQLRQREVATKEKLQKKMSQRAAMKAVLKEESRKVKAEQAALEAVRKEDKQKAKTEQMKLARILLEEEKAVREAEREEARLRLEERRMAQEEARLQREADRLAAAQDVKRREAAAIKAAAVAELQAAIERVERAQTDATMVDADPTYELDCVSVSNKSIMSTRSIKSLARIKIKKNKGIGNKKARRGNAALSTSRDEDDYLGGLNANSADSRDDVDPTAYLGIAAKLSKQSSHGSKGSAKKRCVSFEGEKLSPETERIRREGEEADARARHEAAMVLARADALARPADDRRLSDNDLRERPIVEEGAGGPPKPNSLQAWLEWFMGDEECCSGGSCGSSYSDVDEGQVGQKRALPRFTRKKSLVA